MFMCFIQFQAVAIREQTRSPDQRRIIVPNQVILPVIEDLPDLATMHDRPTGLLRQQVRQRVRAALQSDRTDAVICRRCGRRRAAAGQESVNIVNDGDIMAALDQCLRHALYADCITAKGIRRVESREHDDAQRSQPEISPVNEACLCACPRMRNMCQFFTHKPKIRAAAK